MTKRNGNHITSLVTSASSLQLANSWDLLGKCQMIVLFNDNVNSVMMNADKLFNISHITNWLNRFSLLKSTFLKHVHFPQTSSFSSNTSISSNMFIFLKYIFFLKHFHLWNVLVIETLSQCPWTSLTFYIKKKEYIAYSSQGSHNDHLDTTNH